MPFTDIHIHALFGVDDGAKTEKEMYAIVDASYADGIRTICLTPHFHPGYFGDNRAASDRAFEQLRSYCREQYADLELFLGNELRYSKDCISWLEHGACRTIHDSRYVLVDFQATEEASDITRGAERLLNTGYIPILAHVERYRNLDMQTIRKLRIYGILIQMDAQSVFRAFGFGPQHRCKKMLSEQLVDIVASDAHNLTSRPPILSDCYSYIARHYGTEYANAICMRNANSILCDTADRKVLD